MKKVISITKKIVFGLFLLSFLGPMAFSQDDFNHFFSDEEYISTAQQQFTQLLLDLLSDGPHYSITWLGSACNPERNRMFAVCRLKNTTSYTRTEVHASGAVVNEKSWGVCGFGDDYSGYVRERDTTAFAYNKSTLVQNYTKTKVYFLLCFAEHDEKGNMTFKFIDEPLQNKNGEEYYTMDTVTYDDFVQSERVYLNRVLKKYRSYITCAKDGIEKVTNDMSSVTYSIYLDEYKNPVAKPSQDCTESYRVVSNYPNWLTDYFHYCNDRRLLHYRLFDDYSATSHLHEINEALDSCLTELKTAYGEMEDRKQALLDEHWKIYHSKDKKEFWLRFIGTVETTCTGWKHETEDLIASADTRFKPFAKKSVYMGLFRENNNKIDESSTLVENAVNNLDLVNSDTDPSLLHSDASLQALENSTAVVSSSLDLRSTQEIKDEVFARISKGYNRPEVDFDGEDEAFVRREYPYYGAGKNVKIDKTIHGKRYFYEGNVKKLGPERISIGSARIFLYDLPEEIRISFAPRADYEKFVQRKAKEHPAYVAYIAKRDEAVQQEVDSVLFQQFQSNQPNGFLYVGGSWKTPKEVIDILLKMK